MVEAIEHCFILWCLAFQGYGWRMENNYSKSLDVINIGRGANGSFAKDVLIDVHYLISKPYLTLVESMFHNQLSSQNVS
jgi:hypothetical protein